MKKLLLILAALIIFTACNNEYMAFTPENGDTVAIMETSDGTMKILLHTAQAPETTKNFIEHATAGKYEGTPFHRIIKDFMIQGGDFENQNGTGGYSYNGPGTSLQDEFHPELNHIKGALSMANSGPNTGGSQFFIVHAEEGTPWLDNKHAIFGYVYDGKDIVDQLAGTKVDGSDRPLEEITIKTVTIKKY